MSTPARRPRSSTSARSLPAGSGSKRLKSGASTTGASQLVRTAKPTTRTLPPIHQCLPRRPLNPTPATPPPTPPTPPGAPHQPPRRDTADRREDDADGGRLRDVEQPGTDRLGREAGVAGALLRHRSERQPHNGKGQRDADAHGGAS